VDRVNAALLNSRSDTSSPRGLSIALLYLGVARHGMELPIHASKPAGTRRILIVSESEDLRLLLAQLVAMEWPNAEIHEWDPCVPKRTPGAVGRTDADVVLVDNALEDAGVFPEGLTAHPGHPPIVWLLDGAIPRSHGNAALPLHKSDLSPAALARISHRWYGRRPYLVA
jgi:hypothetical protein